MDGNPAPEQIAVTTDLSPIPVQVVNAVALG
jgi:hypothetical protein